MVAEQAAAPLARVPPEVVRLFCIADGMNLGGRPARSRRCTKRLGSQFCWNWREPRADRCWRHARQTQRVKSSGCGLLM
jgi:hypothetical protein